MFDSILIFIFINIAILTIIFWVIMIIGEKFLYKNITISDREVFECGFLSINNLKIKPNYNFIIIAILLIIYDLEFFFFIPLFFNLNFINYYYFLILLIIYVFLILSFLFDWQNISLNWFV